MILQLIYLLLITYSTVTKASLDNLKTNSIDSTVKSNIEIPQELVTTSISPAENFIGFLVDPIGWAERLVLEYSSSLQPIVIEKFFKNLRFLLDGLFAPVRHIGLHFGALLNYIADKFLFIYPGTKWCGKGDFTDSTGLGIFSETDTCCKVHDKCKMNLISGESQYGLLNNGLFTRSHCDCDREFYTCLKSVGSLISIKVGITYFDILSPQCFAEEFPATCERYERETFGREKCIEYRLNYWKPKTYQWFDVPDYTRKHPPVT